MSTVPQNTPYPGLTAAYLAELLKRLRLVVEDPAPRNVADPVRAHGDLPRLAVVARVLAIPGRTPAGRGLGWTRLGTVLGELTAFLSEFPALLPEAHAGPLSMLADHLDEMLQRLDDGATAAEVAGDAGWQHVYASLCAAGTPGAVLVRLAEHLDLWERSGDDAGAVCPAMTKDLQRHWLDLRRRGDLLFGGTAEAPSTRIEPGAVSAFGLPARIMVLVTGILRREQIRQRLLAGGCQVLVPADVADALTMLAQASAPSVVVCDNLEPSNHLLRLRTGLVRSGRSAIPRLVLLSGADTDGESERHRIVALGALGAWRDPFELSALAAIVSA